MKKLSKILQDIQHESVPVKDLSIKDICLDSRKASDGSLFAALRGSKVDGHEFIPRAIASGATAIICEEIPENQDQTTCFIKVTDSTKALAKAASNFYDRPSNKLTLVGVTGTNGKTSIATLLYDLFTSLGYKCGLLSTIKVVDGKSETEASHTTPDSITINRHLANMVEAGCQYCFMEASSHAIHQNRIHGLDFKAGIFTNITHEHLDYHKTFDEYLRVKKSFFDQLPEYAIAITNKDDRNGLVMLQNTRAIKKTFAVRGHADYKNKIIERHFDGMFMAIDHTEVWTKFTGEFNASNLTAIYACAMELGQDKTEVLQALSNLIPVPGRFETIKSPAGKTAIVDYAHTPDALLNVLKAINKIRNQGQKIITVFGAGGDRDREKRPVMGKIASLNSDKIIITSDNPRFEDPDQIINEVETGVPLERKNTVLKIANREEAIKVANQLASEIDIILLAGKGHETYQIIKNKKVHFDDKEIIIQLFNHQ